MSVGEELDKELSAIKARLDEAEDGIIENTVAAARNTARLDDLDNDDPEDPPEDPPADLKFKPPVLDRPLEFRVPPTGAPNGLYNFEIPDRRDAIFFMPDVPRREPMRIAGGNNYRVIGGKFDLTDWSPDWMARALMVSPWGEVFVEGVMVETGGKEVDAFVTRQSDSPTGGVLTLQNVYAKGMDGHTDRVHGDFIHTQHRSRRLHKLRIERAVSWTRFNGMVTQWVREMELRHIELHKEDITRNAQNSNFAVSTGLRLSLFDAWIDATMIRRDRSLVFARDVDDIEDMRVTRAVVEPRLDQGSKKVGATIQMPTLRETNGHWNIGVPEGGSRSPGSPGLVDPSEIGLNYVSPWPIN